MSIKEALGEVMRTTFIYSISGLTAIGIIWLAVLASSIGLNGGIVICAGLATAIVPLYVIRNKRDKAEMQRLMKPTRYLTDEQRHAAIEYLIKAKKQKSSQL